MWQAFIYLFQSKCIVGEKKQTSRAQSELFVSGKGSALSPGDKLGKTSEFKVALLVIAQHKREFLVSVKDRKGRWCMCYAFIEMVVCF